eukprot:3705910-Prymnesium_polylepis.1
MSNSRTARHGPEADERHPSPLSQPLHPRSSQSGAKLPAPSSPSSSLVPSPLRRGSVEAVAV